MKKVLVSMLFLSGLQGAEDCTFQVRASNLDSSVQTNWPLSMPITIAACGALALYAGYKACASRGPRITVVESSHHNEELFNVGKPYLYAYACRHLVLEKVRSLAASDDTVNSFVPAEIKNAKAVNASYATPCEDYLHKHLFTQKNRGRIQSEIFSAQRVPIKKSDTVFFEIKGRESFYRYTLHEDDIKTINPQDFFKMPEFLADTQPYDSIKINLHCVTIIPANGIYVNGPDQYEAVGPAKEPSVTIEVTKYEGFITNVLISDYRDENGKRGTSCKEHRFTADEITVVNQNYLKELFVKAGGTLYTPQPKSAPSVQPQKSHYALYNPLRWLCTLLRRS